MIRPTTALLLLFAACATPTEELKQEAAPEEEKREQALRDGEAKRRDFSAVILRLDQSIDSYVQALSNHGEVRADQAAERLERAIRETVLDIGPVAMRGNLQAPPPGENYRRLQAAATDGTLKNQQGVALAALGFSGQDEMMPLILQGAQTSDPFLIDRAVLGLAVLKAPQTPPGVLAAIAERQTHPEDGRVQAAWALYQVQGNSERGAEITAIWRRFLTELRDTMPAGVLVTAVRGIGFARDPLVYRSGAGTDMVSRTRPRASAWPRPWHWRG